MTDEPRYYAGIVEVKEVETVDGANAMLSAGWELLAIKERLSFKALAHSLAQVSTLVYVVGRKVSPRPRETPLTAPAQSAPTPRKPTPPPSTMIERLEALPWTEAQSKKCDFSKDAPADLVAAVRGSKDGIKGTAHHFTAATDAPTLFRFRRSARS